MRKLRLTTLQIREKYEREVRERTNARIEALFSEEDNEHKDKDKGERQQRTKTTHLGNSWNKDYRYKK
jgi:hypothetical protein